MVAILEASYRLLAKTEPWSAYFREAAVPPVAAVTYIFAQLQPQDAASWQRLPTRQEIVQLGKGLVAGGSAIGAVLAFAASQGWVSAPSWGWEHTPASKVAQSIALLTTQHILSVWQEEMVFRGYGFDTLRQAIGLPAAIVCSSLLFAIYHGFNPRMLVSMTLAGVLLSFLRLEHENLWLPFGFHLGWNLLQVVLFGPSTANPSLRPLLVHGPAEWIGQPGYPEPGYLVTLVVAMIVGFLFLRRRRRA